MSSGPIRKNAGVGDGGIECLTPKVLSDAQSKTVFGPLDDARVVEDDAGQDHPLAPHHRLVCRLLREPRCPH